MKTINANLNLFEFLCNMHHVVFVIAVIAIIVFIVSIVALFENFDDAKPIVAIALFASAIVTGCAGAHLSDQCFTYNHNQKVINSYVNHEISNDSITIHYVSNEEEGIIDNETYPVKYKVDLDEAYFDVASGTYYAVFEE